LSYIVKATSNLLKGIEKIKNLKKSLSNIHTFDSFRVQGSGFRVLGSGFWVLGSGFWVGMKLKPE